MAYFHNLFYAIKAMHGKFGKGELTDARTEGTTVHLTTIRTSCLPHHVKGSYDGTWLKLYGHKRKVITQCKA